MHGEIEVHGRIAGSSNATLLVTCSLEGEALRAVYKPARGERPLWDFPAGLYRREVAAYLVSELVGWHLVPETVERADGPFGPGSVQRFVPTDGTSHYFTLVDDPDRHEMLRTIAAFDVVTNNADRKSGHVLLAGDRIWAIDHGLSFHRDPKLRTVIWDFAGTPLPPSVQSDLERLLSHRRDQLDEVLAGLLDRDERSALWERTAALASTGRLPVPDTDREWPPYPWPLV
ncbi:MAG: SCO1664 family protein [Acidimicrobiales bacterium]